MCPFPPKIHVTFFHFELISIFSSATSYLIRSYPAYWIVSGENSAAFPLTHWMWLSAQQGHITGSVFVGKRLALAFYFHGQSFKEISCCASKSTLNSYYIGSSQKWKEKARPESNVESVLQAWGDSRNVWSLKALWASALIPQHVTGPQTGTAT